jgi:hypothetical protein
LQRDLNAREEKAGEEQARQDFDLTKIGIENENLIKRQKQAYDLATQQQKDAKLDAEKDQAILNGLSLPPGSTHEDYLRANAKENSKNIVEAMQAINSAQDAYAQAKGQTRQQLWQASVGQAIQNASKNTLSKLSLQDLQALMASPESAGQVIDKISASGNRDLWNAVIEIQSLATQNTEKGMEEAEKEKGFLSLYTDRAKTANKVLEKFINDPRYSPYEVTQALKTFGSVAFPKQQAQPNPQAPPLPPPPGGGAGAPTVPSPVPTGTVPGIIPTAASALAAAPGRLHDAVHDALFNAASGVPSYLMNLVPENVQRGGRNLLTTLFGGQYIPPPNPQLQNFLKKNLADQSAIAPTAFPVTTPGFDDVTTGLE